MIEIELNNIKKNYGLKNVLDGVSFEIKTGERIALIGDNGSGKSTLMKAMRSLYYSDRNLIEKNEIISTPAEIDQMQIMINEGTFPQAGNFEIFTTEKNNVTVYFEPYSVFIC